MERLELTEPEMRVMRPVWDAGTVSAKDVVEALARDWGYNASTTYTLIYRCIKKKALFREDPGFLLSAAVTREVIQDNETKTLVDKLFDGSVDNLFAALVSRKKVSAETLERVRGMIDEYEEEQGIGR
jgi:predicted transcriptional regulator